ncbi:MAG: DUF445 family protein [Anaerovoracaceae bacterium]
MTLNMIMGPVVGAVIGYCTNYIAVKMLFRPLKPKYIGKFKIPFTPGIIPKGRDRLAKAVGEAVGGTLLTEESLKATLLSEELKSKVGEEAKAFLKAKELDETLVRDKLLNYMEEDRLNQKVDNACELISSKIYNKIEEMDIGTVVANQVVTAVKEKVQGSFVAMMLNDQLLESFVPTISTKINEYIETYGKTTIDEKIQIEKNNVLTKGTNELVMYISDFGINIEKFAINIYESLITQKLNIALEHLNLTKIVENQIMHMDILDLENLILSVMKKELNAIVNLGAIIGFVLGLVMIFV